MDQHRHGRHDHHHGAGGRDGVGDDDLAAADHRRRTRRRLGEGQDRAGAGHRGDLRQSGFLPPVHVHLVTKRGVELLPAAAPRWRAGAPSSARQCANRLGVPVAELTTEPSVVVHATSGRRLSYGDIASFAEIPAQAPTIDPEELKKPSDFRLIGKDVMRVELPSKVNGSATYSIDVQVPGMLYGIVVRAPVEGSMPVEVDESTVRAIPGVMRVVRLPYGVGALAETAWAALAARRALNDAITWSRTGATWGFDSEMGLDAFAADASNLGAPATDWGRKGDAAGEMARAATVLEATYRADFAYHAQMEPLNAVASVSPAGDAVELWCGTQNQSAAVDATARALGITRDRVKLNYLLLGGGFGRRGHVDEEFSIDAVLLSKEVR